MEIQKIHEDADILVINKPYGLVVNRSETTSSPTLQDYLDEHYSVFKDYVAPESTEENEETEFFSRSGIVHRLDKDTSGVLIVGLNIDSFNNLLAQFKSREVHKEYVAVVWGKISEENLEINAPIKRSPANRMKYALDPDGKEAITKASRVSEFSIDDNIFTVLNVFPETGRTHQIRVHMAAISHPVVGDVIYSSRKQFEKSTTIFNRLMLHAKKISFKHPKSGEYVEFECSIPDDISKFIKTM